MEAYIAGYARENKPGQLIVTVSFGEELVKALHNTFGVDARYKVRINRNRFVMGRSEDSNGSKIGHDPSRKPPHLLYQTVFESENNSIIPFKRVQASGVVFNNKLLTGNFVIEPPISREFRGRAPKQVAQPPVDVLSSVRDAVRTINVAIEEGELEIAVVDGKLKAMMVFT